MHRNTPQPPFVLEKRPLPTSSHNSVPAAHTSSLNSASSGDCLSDATMLWWSPTCEGRQGEEGHKCDVADGTLRR